MTLLLTNSQHFQALALSGGASTRGAWQTLDSSPFHLLVYVLLCSWLHCIRNESTNISLFSFHVFRIGSFGKPWLNLVTCTSTPVIAFYECYLRCATILFHA